MTIFYLLSDFFFFPTVLPIFLCKILMLLLASLHMNEHLRVSVYFSVSYILL